MNSKLEEFRSSKQYGAVVFCVKCGSASLDQNFKFQLRCYNCQNVSIWDSSRFSVARDGAEQDVIDGIRAAEAQPQVDDGDWKQSILDAQLPFLHDLTEVSVYGTGKEIAIEKKDLDNLIAAWATCKASVDAVIENLLTRPGAVYE